MAKRSSYKQSKHDRKVKEVAKNLERKGWNVEADIAGFSTPDSIGTTSPRIPDIVATKSGAKKIIEVETKDTINKDKKQHQVFRRSAAQQNRTTFEVINADD